MADRQGLGGRLHWPGTPRVKPTRCFAAHENSGSRVRLEVRQSHVCAGPMQPAGQALPIRHPFSLWRVANDEVF